MERGNIEQHVRRYANSLNCRSRAVQLAIKRVLDILLALLATVVALPLMAVLIICIRLESPGAAIYRQRRLGQGGHPFTMYKLRSMRADCEVVLNPDGSTCVVEDDPRLTWLGKSMRTFGLDELPQLFNVLRGEMSLVGPRPDQDFHLQWYDPSDYRKLAMRPGITSLGQVIGRNSIPWKERILWEVEYVERFSLWLDLKIVLRTLAVVVSGIGAYNLQSKPMSAPSASANDKTIKVPTNPELPSPSPQQTTA